MKFISSFLLEYIIYIREEERLPELFFVPRSAFVLYTAGKYETFDTDSVLPVETRAVRSVYSQIWHFLTSRFFNAESSLLFHVYLNVCVW